jgi:hypothetical protein
MISFGSVRRIISEAAGSPGTMARALDSSITAVAPSKVPSGKPASRFEPSGPWQ